MLRKKKVVIARIFCERAVIKILERFLLVKPQNQPQKALTCQKFRYSEFRNIPSCRSVLALGADEFRSVELTRLGIFRSTDLIRTVELSDD
jgi:hypothetical protein